MLRTTPLLVAVLLGSALACQTTSSPDAIDTALLVEVPEDQRQRIDEARREVGRRADEIARAERAVRLAEDELDIVETERDVAEARLDESEKRIDLARDQGVDSETMDLRRSELEDARAFRRWVEARIAKQEARIDQARADLERARAREELAKAHLQLLQARALEDLGRSDTADIDVDAFQRRVDELELEMGDAQIAYESAERRTGLRNELVSERAEAVPARYRSTVEDIEKESQAREAAAERQRQSSDQPWTEDEPD